MIPAACMTRTALDWQRPTPDQIREYLDSHGITPYRAHKLIGVSKATPGRWLLPVEHQLHISIQFAHWSALVRAVES